MEADSKEIHTIRKKLDHVDVMVSTLKTEVHDVDVRVKRLEETHNELMSMSLTLKKLVFGDDVTKPLGERISLIEKSSQESDSNVKLIFQEIRSMNARLVTLLTMTLLTVVGSMVTYLLMK